MNFRPDATAVVNRFLAVSAAYLELSRQRAAMAGAAVPADETLNRRGDSLNLYARSRPGRTCAVAAGHSPR